MINRRVAVFVSGRGSNLQALIDASNHNYIPIEIALVVTNNNDAGAVSIARNANIPVFYLEEGSKTREEYDSILVQNCQDNNVDFVILAGWMRVLSSVFINQYINKILNIHPALPGTYPGTNAIRRAYNDARDGKTNVTIKYRDKNKEYVFKLQKSRKIGKPNR